MELSKQEYIIKLITVFFFTNASIEVIAEFFACKPILYFTKPLIPILIMVLYWFSSLVKNKLFFIIMFFSILTNIFFIPNTAQFLFYGVITFTIHRIFLLFYVFKEVKINSYFGFILATIPILLLFLYLFIESSNVPDNSFYILLFHVILISILCGVALSNYIKDDNLQNTFLMICALLFTGLQLVIYIEKYFLNQSYIEFLRPIAMTLNVLAFYSFYRFVSINEEIKQQ